MRQLILLLSSMGLCLLGSTMLLASMWTPNWVIWTILGEHYYEGLWNACILGECQLLKRDWVYNVFVLTYLVLGTISGFTCIILSPFFWMCGRKDIIQRASFNTPILSVITTMIGMSVYTGKYTRDVPLELRGWSFFLAWCSFPLYLIAAFLRVFPMLLHLGCMETFIHKRSSPPTEVSASTNGHGNQICSNAADQVFSV